MQEKKTEEIMTQADALQNAVMGFVTRSDVAAVAMGIDELLEGHPLCDVWTRLLEARDVSCVADLYGLKLTDLTAIRGIGPAAIGDIITALESRRPWKYRLASRQIDVDTDEVSDADVEEECSVAVADPTDMPVEQAIGDVDVAKALQAVGIHVVGDLLALTMAELAGIDGIGEDGACAIAEKLDGLDLEMTLETGEKPGLVGELAAKRVNDLEQELAEGDSMPQVPEVDIPVDAAAAPEAHAAPVDVETPMSSPAPDDGQYRPDSMVSVLSEMANGTLVAAVLAENGITIVDDMRGCALGDIAGIVGIGTRAAGEIEAALVSHGYPDVLRKDESAPIPMAMPEQQVPAPFVADVPAPSFQAQPAPSVQPEPAAWVPSPVPQQVDLNAMAQTPQVPAPQPQPEPDPFAPVAYPGFSPAPANDATGQDNPEGRDPFVPSPSAAESVSPDVTRPLEPIEANGTFTPEGFVADGDDDDTPVVEQTTIAPYETRPGIGRIAMLAGIGLVAVSAALGIGVFVGGNVAHADCLDALVQATTLIAQVRP